MDTSGKGGTVKHVIGQLNPSGCRIRAFKAPTEEERRHDFLWRVRRALPGPGEIGIFDRSHYEDVLVARVRHLARPAEIGSRYGLINDFERALADDGVTLVKCFLHLSYDEQRRLCCAVSTAPASAGSSIPVTSTNAPCGPPTRRRTSWRWSAARPRTRPGTWSRRTASGTATGRSAGSCWSSCASWIRAIRRPTSMWRGAGSGC